MRGHNPFSHGPSSAVPANRIFKASKLTTMKTAQTETGGGINIDNLEPGTYTLQFSFAMLPPDAFGIGKAVPSVWAEVTWTLDGQQQRRLVSVVPGLSITGQCEGVTVTYYDKQGVLGGGANPGLEYAIQSSLSSGCRPTVNQPPVLINSLLQSITEGNVLEFDIPEDSGVISFYLSAGLLTPPAGFETKGLIQWRQVRRATSDNLLIGDVLNVNGWIPLAPAADRIEISYSPIGGAPPEAFINVLWGIQG